MKGEKFTQHPKLADAKAEKIPQVDFWDLVMGEGRDGAGKPVACIDSLRLEETLTSGAFPLERFSEVSGGETAQWLIDHGYDVERNRRFAAANPNYMETHDNMWFRISSHDHERLANDFAAWLRTHTRYIEVLDRGHPESRRESTIEHVLNNLLKDNKDSLHADQPTIIDFTDEYPTLQHNLILDYIHEENGMSTLRGDFTRHKAWRQVEPVYDESQADPLDFLSLLKIMNGFKRSGYEIEFKMGYFAKRDEHGVATTESVMCYGK